jgi:hypothetical protein
VKVGGEGILEGDADALVKVGGEGILEGDTDALVKARGSEGDEDGLAKAWDGEQVGVSERAKQGEGGE